MATPNGIPMALASPIGVVSTLPRMKSPKDSEPVPVVVSSAATPSISTCEPGVVSAGAVRSSPTTSEPSLSVAVFKDVVVFSSAAVVVFSSVAVVVVVVNDAGAWIQIEVPMPVRLTKPVRSKSTLRRPFRDDATRKQEHVVGEPRVV